MRCRLPSIAGSTQTPPQRVCEHRPAAPPCGELRCKRLRMRSWHRCRGRCTPMDGSDKVRRHHSSRPCRQWQHLWGAALGPPLPPSLSHVGHPGLRGVRGGRAAPPRPTRAPAKAGWQGLAPTAAPGAAAAPSQPTQLHCSRGPLPAPPHPPPPPAPHQGALGDASPWHLAPPPPHGVEGRGQGHGAPHPPNPPAPSSPRCRAPLCRPGAWCRPAHCR